MTTPNFVVSVYLLTNTLNGKQYVGQTKEAPENRLKQHLKNTHCRALSAALRKYGVEAFTLQTLASCTGQHEADEVERGFIRAFNTLSPNGYNLREGGVTRHSFSEESLRLISEKAKARGVSQVCKEAQRKATANPSIEVRQTRREIMLRLRSDPDFMARRKAAYGRQDVRDRMSAAAKNRRAA